MRQVLFEIPGLGLPIHGYGVMVLLGALFGYLLLHREAKRRGWTTDWIADFAVVAVLSGIVGGRIFYCIQDPDGALEGAPFTEYFKIWQGGLVLYGGIIGGTIATVIFLRAKKIPVMPFFDAASPSLAIGIAFGRLGCFMNGCCWGQQCSPDAWYATNFPEGSAAFNRFARAYAENPLIAQSPTEVHVVPMQLVSAGAAVLLCGALYFLQRRKLPTGFVGGAFFASYAAIRWTIENFRGDHGVSGNEWTASQWVSLVGAGLGLALIAASVLKGRSSTADQTSPDPAEA